MLFPFISLFIEILTPPLPLPYKGGERLRIDFYSNFGMFGLFSSGLNCYV